MIRRAFGDDDLVEGLRRGEAPADDPMALDLLTLRHELGRGLAPDLAAEPRIGAAGRRRRHARLALVMAMSAGLVTSGVSQTVSNDPGAPVKFLFQRAIELGERIGSPEVTTDSGGPDLGRAVGRSVPEVSTGSGRAPSVPATGASPDGVPSDGDGPTRTADPSPDAVEDQEPPPSGGPAGPAAAPGGTGEPAAPAQPSDGGAEPDQQGEPDQEATPSVAAPSAPVAGPTGGPAKPTGSTGGSGVSAPAPSLGGPITATGPTFVWTPFPTLPSFPWTTLTPALPTSGGPVEPPATTDPENPVDPQKPTAPTEEVDPTKPEQPSVVDGGTPSAPPVSVDPDDEKVPDEPAAPSKDEPTKALQTPGKDEPDDGPRHEPVKSRDDRHEGPQPSWKDWARDRHSWRKSSTDKSDWRDTKVPWSGRSGPGRRGHGEHQRHEHR